MRSEAFNTLQQNIPAHSGFGVHPSRVHVASAAIFRYPDLQL